MQGAIAAAAVKCRERDIDLYMRDGDSFISGAINSAACTISLATY